jgi:hypothetical protein
VAGAGYSPAVGKRTMTACGIIARSNKNHRLLEIVMKIMSADDRLLLPLKLCNIQIARTVRIAGQLAFVGASHG